MTVTVLHVSFCGIVDFPDDPVEGCELLSPENGTRNLDNCFKCQYPGKYMVGGSVDNLLSPGPVLAAFIYIGIFNLGIFGMFANGIVIRVLRRRKKLASFDLLLCCLATVDLWNSVMAFVSSTAVMFIFAKFGDELLSIYIYVISIIMFYIGKSASSYLTVLITAERYMVIAHPFTAMSWLTERRTKFMAVTLLLSALLINTPRFSAMRIAYNHHGQNIQGLIGRHWLIIQAPEPYWYQTLGVPCHVIDSLAPFPLLLMFNVLTFVKISNFAKARQKLSRKQKGDIRGAKMFLPVVVVLFICNVPQIIYYFLLRFKGILYRDIGFSFFLCVILNSAVNLPIYYARGPAFREEIRNSLPGWVKRCFNKLPQEITTTMSSTGYESGANAVVLK